jgi:hypothetical protein
MLERLLSIQNELQTLEHIYSYNAMSLQVTPKCQGRCPHRSIGVLARIRVSETGTDAKFTTADEDKINQIPIH